MKKIMGYHARYLVQNLILSGIISFAAVLCLPNIVNWSIGMEVEGLTFSLIGTIAACVMSLAITFFMSKDRCNAGEDTKASLMKVIITVFGTIAILFVGVVFLSLLCGIIAWLLYFALKNVLTQGQIKGVVDFVTTVVAILSLPFVISVFWHAVSAKSGFRLAFTDGVILKRKQYVRVLALMCLLFGIGLLLSTAFHYASTNALMYVVKILFFTAMGTVGMTVSEKIVM